MRSGEKFLLKNLASLFTWLAGSMKPLAGSTPTRVGPMKASRGIEEMTRSPHLIKEFRTQRQNETDSSPSRPLGHKRASSMTNLTGRTPSPVNYDSDDGEVWHNSLDTSTIRQAVFDDWMSKKNERLKKELAKKMAAKKKQEEKKKEEHFEKTEGVRSMCCWIGPFKEGSMLPFAKKNFSEMQSPPQKNSKPIP